MAECSTFLVTSALMEVRSKNQVAVYAHRLRRYDESIEMDSRQQQFSHGTVLLSSSPDHPYP